MQNAATREVLYTLRVNGDSFTPLVREPGTYTVLAYDPDGGYFRSWAGFKGTATTASLRDLNFHPLQRLPR